MMPFRWLSAAVKASGAWSLVTTSARHMGVQAALAAVLGLLWLTAFAFLLAAGTVWLASHLGVAAALAIVGAVLALAGVVVLLVMHHHRKRRPAAATGLAGLMAGAAAPDEASEVSDNEAIESLAGLAFIGYILGRLVRSSS
jgi:hypothetical protein